MFMFNSIESIKVAHFQKLTNQSMLNGALVLEMINNFFSESKKNFLIEKRETFQKKKKKKKEKRKNARNVLIGKNKATGSEKFISPRFR